MSYYDPVGWLNTLILQNNQVWFLVPTKWPTSYYDHVGCLNTLLLQKTEIWLQYPQSGPHLSMTMWDDSTLCCCRRSRFGYCSHKVAHVLLMTLERTFVFQRLTYVIDKKISTSSILFIAWISCFQIYDWIKIHCICTSYSLFIYLDTYHLTLFFSKQKLWSRRHMWQYFCSITYSCWI